MAPPTGQSTNPYNFGSQPIQAPQAQAAQPVPQASGSSLYPSLSLPTFTGYSYQQPPQGQGQH